MARSACVACVACGLLLWLALLAWPAASFVLPCLACIADIACGLLVWPALLACLATSFVLSCLARRHEFVWLAVLVLLLLLACLVRSELFIVSQNVVENDFVS